jgi:hypothetical protein
MNNFTTSCQYKSSINNQRIIRRSIWFRIIHAIKLLTENEGHGLLPVQGEIPDRSIRLQSFLVDNSISSNLHASFYLGISVCIYVIYSMKNIVVIQVYYFPMRNKLNNQQVCLRFKKPMKNVLIM